MINKNNQGLSGNLNKEENYWLTMWVPEPSSLPHLTSVSLYVRACGGSGLGLLVFLDNSPPYILFIWVFFTCGCVCGVYHVYIHSRVYDTCIIRHMHTCVYVHVEA